MEGSQKPKEGGVDNPLNGGSNLVCLKKYEDACATAATLPTLSVSIAEDEVRGIGAENVVGQLVAWNYYQTTKTPENTKFVAAYKAKYGADRVTDDPIEAGYFGVYLWKLAVEKAKSTDVAAVKAAAKGIEFAAPEGMVKIDGDNQHTYKTVRIGKIRADGLIDEVSATDTWVKPDPYLCNVSWRGTLPTPTGGCPPMASGTMAATMSAAMPATMAATP